MKDVAWWLFGALSAAAMGLAPQLDGKSSVPMLWGLLIVSAAGLLGMALYALGKRAARKQASMDSSEAE